MIKFIFSSKFPTNHNSNFLHFSTSISSSSSSNFMSEYLVTSLGFSPQKAAVVSKHISHATSSSKPDAVRHFLKHVVGMTDLQIRTLVANYPPMLFCNTQGNMVSNLSYLRKTKIFTKDELCDFIARNPQSLQLTSTIAHFTFWSDFFKDDVMGLKLTLMRNRNLIARNIDTLVAPKIAALEEYDLPHKSIAKLFARGSCFFELSTASVKSLLKRVEELGFARGSPMFVLAIMSFCGLKNETIKAKMELLKSFGWSNEEIRMALLKFPNIFCLSEGNIRPKMRFLLQNAGCTHGYLAHNPYMLGLSLKKRLIPRHHVMETLKSNNLLGKESSFCTIVTISEKNFVAKFVLPYEATLPKLLETYSDACAGKLLL